MGSRTLPECAGRVCYRAIWGKPVCEMSHLCVLYSVVWVIWDRKRKVVTDLQEATGVVLLNHLQAVLHEARGLAQFHCAMRDLVPDHLRLAREQKGGCETAEGVPHSRKFPQSRIQAHHGNASTWRRIVCVAL